MAIPPDMGRRVVLCGVVVVVLLSPFAFAPSRLLHPAPWVMVVAALLVYLSQPTPPRRELQSPADGGTARLIVIGANLATLAPIIEFVARPQLMPAAMSWWVGAGAAIVLAGVALRIAAIAALGSFFTAVVEVKPSQTVIRSGPYAKLRHPSYSGVLLSLLGECIMFASVSGVVLTLAVMLPIYLRRIRFEEVAMVNALGDEYRRYQAEVGALVPKL